MKKILQLLSTAIFFVHAQAQGDSWQQMQSLGNTTKSRWAAAGFSIADKGYIGTGDSRFPNNYLSDFWEYDPATNVWTQKADFGGTGRNSATGFSIGNKGYIATGWDSDGATNDLWEYDPTANTWKKRANFPGSKRLSATSFTIGNKGYVGTGIDDVLYILKRDFWEYDPSADTWTRKADFGGNERTQATGFSIGNKGYIGTGVLEYGYAKDFWEYDPVINTWTQKADFGGGYRGVATGFSIGDNGYIGTGGFKDFWEYNPASDTWTQKADFGGIARSGATGISIGNYGYIGFGEVGFLTYTNDFWQYTPSDILPLNLTSFTATLQKQDALLNWQTTNEINTSYFNIQRSYNGVNFSTIAKQNAVGNNATGVTQKYNYTDKNVTALQQQKIFYRLQMVDKDGSAAYSNIAELNVNNNSGIAFFIYPNPAKDKLHINISCAENETLSIRITDMYGRELYAEKISVVAGTVNHDIDVNKLAKGIYTIQLISDKGVSKGKFVKE